MNYATPFPYIAQAHVIVTVNGTDRAFTWVNTGTIRLFGAPAANSSIVVKRVTPRNTRLVDFADGSFLTERELDLSALQLLYISQEIIDDVTDTLEYDFSTDKYDAQGKPITNVGDPINDADVVTLKYYKTVVLPMVLNTVNDAMNAFTNPFGAEVETYRKLLEDYRKRLDAATNNMESTTNAAVIRIEELSNEAAAQHNTATTRIEGMSNEAKAKYDAFLSDLQALATLLTQQAESVRLAGIAATDARDEARAVTADIKDFRFMGDWRNDGTVYRPQNVVYHGGSSFVLISGDGTGEPGTGTGTNWKFLAKRGESYYARVIDGGEPDTGYVAFIDGGTPEAF